MKKSGWFQFLSSLRLAVSLLVILVLAMAVGTIVESRISPAEAKRVVYGSSWFALLLFLLALNVFCSALSRWPWKKRQAGFVTTHAGILLILGGSLLTQWIGLDGQLALAEGETGNEVEESAPFFQVADERGALGAIPARFAFRDPSRKNPEIHALSGGATLAFTGYLQNGRKVLAAVEPAPGDPAFDAVRIELRSSLGGEETWLFAGHPEYASHALGPARLTFAPGRDFQKALGTLPRNGLVIVRHQDGSLRFQSKYRGKLLRPRTLEKDGVPYPTGWMDMDLVVLESRKAAVPVHEYLGEPVAPGEEAVPAIRYRLSNASQSREGWIEWRSRAVETLGGNSVTLSFGPQKTHLPFSLRLDKFDIGFNPGTDRPASYASRVRLTDSAKGIDRAVTLSMNKPLQHRGFTFFQAGYSRSEGGDAVSVFSVAKDPGIFLKYAGSLVLVLGILLMYLVKK